jgi:hypothetical protein
MGLGLIDDFSIRQSSRHLEDDLRVAHGVAVLLLVVGHGDGAQTPCAMKAFWMVHSRFSR